MTGRNRYGDFLDSEPGDHNIAMPFLHADNRRLSPNYHNKVHTPEYLSESGITSPPPCLMKEAIAKIVEGSHVSDSLKRNQALFLPLFLPEEFSCHDFHEEGMGFAKELSFDTSDTIDLPWGRRIPRIPLKPRISPRTSPNLSNSPDLPCIDAMPAGLFVNTSHDHGDDDDTDYEMTDQTAMEEELVEMRISSPDDIRLLLPLQVPLLKISSRSSQLWGAGPSDGYANSFVGPSNSSLSVLRRPVAHRNDTELNPQRRFIFGYNAPVNGANFSFRSDNNSNDNDNINATK